jgi:peroxiredoxin Q/BCP
MSKKTRAKSSGASAGKASRANAAAAAKMTPSKTRKPAANKASKAAKTRQTGNRTAKPSQKTSSKAAKSPRAAKPGRPATAGSGTRTANPAPKKDGATAASRSVLAAGMRAPSFSLPRDGGSTVALGDYAGRKLVLFFYPRADTPGCTREAIDFTRLAAAFAANQTAVLGVSADPLKAQESFRNKHQLSVPLASDETHAMLQAYGAWGEKSMYGRTFQGIIRTTVLVGSDGRIVKVWRNVRVDGHAEEVLAAARGA